MSESPLDELIAQAELGIEARKFVESDLGRCLVGMARQEVEAATMDLEKVDATDHHKIRDIQLRIRLGKNFERWLCELITKGDEALEVYKQHEQTE